MFTIETNIPLPARTNPNAGTNAKYPLADMLVGDSFLYPAEPATLADRRRLSSALASYSSRHKDVKFAVRTVDGGLRVWRVA